MLKIIVIASFFSLKAIGSEYPIWDQLTQKFGLESQKQSFCLGNGEHQVNGDLRVRPASVTKLYVTYWALKILGPDYRFKTSIKIYPDQIEIHGGGDTFFTSENIFYFTSLLNERGVKSTKKLNVVGSFLFNWKEDPRNINSLLSKYLNVKSWNQSLKNEYEHIKETLDQLDIDQNLPSRVSFSVDQIVRENSNTDVPTETIIFKSSPLKMHLKQMNIYSNNFMAQKLFDYLGGIKAFHQFMEDEFAASRDKIYFETGSGLGENYTTCKLTLKMLKALDQTIFESGLNYEEIISVPGVDSGTLRNRFLKAPYNRALVAKTGTLRHTSTLAGYLFGPTHAIPFGIFNHSYKTNETREFQNQVVPLLFELFDDPFPITYESQIYLPLVNSVIE